MFLSKHVPKTIKIIYLKVLIYINSTNENRFLDSILSMTLKQPSTNVNSPWPFFLHLNKQHQFLLLK